MAALRALAIANGYLKEGRSPFAGGVLGQVRGIIANMRPTRLKCHCYAKLFLHVIQQRDTTQKQFKATQAQQPGHTLIN